MTVLQVEHLQACISSCSKRAIREFRNVDATDNGAYRRPPTPYGPIPSRNMHAAVDLSA